MGLGRNVGKLMKARGLSYSQVARGIGIEDTQPIWALVKRDSKKSQFAGRLAQFFNISLQRLVADDFEIGESAMREPASVYNVRNKDDRLNVQGDGEKLLVLVRTFLDTDAEGRAELLKAATAVSEAHGATSAQSRRAKRR